MRVEAIATKLEANALRLSLFLLSCRTEVFRPPFPLNRVACAARAARAWGLAVQRRGTEAMSKSVHTQRALFVAV